jgi:hypothetical protein
MSVLKARIRVRDDEQKERSHPSTSSLTLSKPSSHINLNVIPPHPKRHPAFNAGSVLYERDNRESFTAVFERMGFCVIPSPRREITDDKCRYLKLASGCGMTNKKEHTPLKTVIPPQRHPALNAGSVLNERDNRESFTAVFERMGFCVIPSTRREITDDKCRYSKPASGCGMTNKKEHTPLKTVIPPQPQRHPASPQTSSRI